MKEYKKTITRIKHDKARYEVVKEIIDHEERDAYYHRLAKEMGIDYENCHFSMMTYEQLEQALKIIKKMWWEKYDR